MHKVLSTRKINHNRLHDYLIATLPGFHLTRPGENGELIALEGCGRVSYDGKSIIIEADESLNLMTLKDAIAAYTE